MAAAALAATAPLPFAVVVVDVEVLSDDVAPLDVGCDVCCLERVDIAASGREAAEQGGRERRRRARKAKALVDLNMRR